MLCSVCSQFSLLTICSQFSLLTICSQFSLLTICSHEEFARGISRVWAESPRVRVSSSSFSLPTNCFCLLLYQCTNHQQLQQPILHLLNFSGSQLLNQLLLSVAVPTINQFYICSLPNQLLWITTVEPTQSAAVPPAIVPIAICWCRCSTNRLSVPSILCWCWCRAQYESRHARDWNKNLSRASWGSHELLDHPPPRSLNSPGKECPVWLQIRHRGHHCPLPCYTINPPLW